LADGLGDEPARPCGRDHESNDDPMNETAAIDAAFCPKRIAVLGASADPSKFGHHLVRSLRDCQFPGDVYPISRSSKDICGYAAFPSLQDVPQPIDLVLISIPVQHVPSAVADAATAAKAAVVFTAGFQEAGEEGRKLQQEMVERANGRIRLIGPNCLGIRNFHLPMNASPMAQSGLEPGPISFVSQSGAFGNAAVAALRHARIGLAKLASIGNMADITHAHLFRYLAGDPQTSVIAAFVEGVPDVPFFLDTIAEVSRTKPIVILKGGRSKSGQRAALSHTGSLAGDGRVWESLLLEAGATFVESSEELFDVAAALARAGSNLPRGRRAAIFSLAGGPGVVAADHCEERGIELPPLEAQLQSLRPIVPPYAALGNPVEVTGQTKREHLNTCAEAIVTQPNVDALIGIAIGLDFAEFANSIIAANEVKPAVACVVAPNSETMLAQAGIPNYPSVDRAVRALRHLMDRGASQRGRDQHRRVEGALGDAGAGPVPARALEARAHSEAESKAYLAGYGLPVTGEQVVDSADSAVMAAAQIGYPVALKVSSATIAHKSDAGGVLLDLRDVVAVRAAADTLQRRFPSTAMLVQKMVASGIELIVGAQRGQATGPIIMIGIGGILTEVLDDVVFCRAPATPATVRDAMARLRSQRLLDGYRGLAPVDRDAVAAIAAKLSEIIVANPSIAEIDLNPVIATRDGAVIVDALIRVEHTLAEGAEMGAGT
jgi:acyl-CoA synthetase (NDP forming)